MSLDLLTNSRLKMFRRCPYLHQKRYVEGYEAIEDAEALRFGSLVHEGLEAWWNGLRFDPGIDGDALLAIALEELATRPSPAGRRQREIDPFELVRAEEMLRAYHYRWLDAGLEPLEVEVEFRAPLINPESGAASRTFEMGGKIDAIARDRDGRVVIVEHKTAGSDVSPGSPYWTRLRLDGQVSQYFSGAAALGYEAAAVLWDVLVKPAQRPLAIPLLDEAGVKIVLDGAGQRVRTKDGKKWRETSDAAQGYALQTRPETVEEYRSRVAGEIAEKPEEKLMRAEIVRLEADRDGYAFDLWATARTMRESQIAARAPRYMENCERPGRCALFAHCYEGASLDDESKFKHLSSPHPELAPTGA